jgi:capsular polysaccharide biosynthesis protein
VSTASDRDTRVSDATQYPRHAQGRFPILLVAVALVLGVIAAGGGYEAVKRHRPTYRAQAYVSIDQPRQIAASTNAGEVDKLARLRATYIGVVKFDSVIDAVAKDVNLKPGQVRRRVFASADPNSLLLILGANDYNGVSARRVATALANEIVVYIQQQQDKYKIPDKDRVLASIVVTPTSAAQVSPTTRKAITAAVVAGLIVFLVIMGLGSLFRRPAR